MRCSRCNVIFIDGRFHYVRIPNGCVVIKQSRNLLYFQPKYYYDIRITLGSVSIIVNLRSRTYVSSTAMKCTSSDLSNFQTEHMQHAVSIRNKLDALHR